MPACWFELTVQKYIYIIYWSVIVLMSFWFFFFPINQVEQHLEQVARQVQDSTQRLTDNIDNNFNPLNKTTDASDWRPQQQSSGQPGGLNRNLSASSDRIFSQVQKLTFT